MKKILAAVLTLGVFASMASAQYYPSKDVQPAIPGVGRVASDARTAGVRVDQKLDGQLPLDLEFTDEHGEKGPLKRFFNRKPVLILPIFYKCPGICSQELASLVNVLNGFKNAEDQPGSRFDIVVVSIDYKETPKMAADKEQTYLELYQRKGTEAGWHFLVGSEENVGKLTDAMGFVFRRDPLNDNITHPAMLLVSTPGGKISKYFLSTQYEQKPLLISIGQAAEEKIGAVDEAPTLFSCINVDPNTGQVSVNVFRILQILGVVTVLALVFSIVRWNKKWSQENPDTGGDTAAP